jgi:glycerol-3-phosphate acyltransferase PlsX
VVLKFYEAVAPMILGLLMRHGAPRSAVEAVMHGFDYARYGGAPLLGVKGVSIICHGKSSAEAIKNAIKVASLAVEHRMTAHIGKSVRAQPLEAAP